MRDLTPVPIHPLDRQTPTAELARFESYAVGIIERCYEIWATLAGRSPARTLRLLARESEEGASLPTASTIRRWAIDGAWAARADADIITTRDRTLHELRTAWTANVLLAAQVLQDSMSGEYDDLPFGGAGRVKSAEIVMKNAQLAGLLALIFPASSAPVDDLKELDDLSLEEREAYLRSKLQARKQAITG